MKMERRFFFYLFIFLKKGLPFIGKEDHQNFKERKVAAHRIIFLLFIFFSKKGAAIYWEGGSPKL